MKKALQTIIVSIAAFVAVYGIAAAVSGCSFPNSLTNFVQGNTIGTCWYNNIEQYLGTGSTSTSLSAQITALSGAKVGSINGISTTSIQLAATGTGLSVSSSGFTITYSISSSSYLQPLNNLSELTNTSTARTNLGLGDSAILPSSTFFKVGNNLSEGVASTMRTNLGLGSIAIFSSSDYLPSSTAYVSSINNGAAGAYSILPGTNVTISTSSNSTTINVSTAAAAAGSDSQVQFNSGGTFGATSSFSYVSSTHVLVTNGTITPTLSIAAGSQASSVTYSYSGATSSFVVPFGVTSITISAQGAGGGDTDTARLGGAGGASTGTITVTAGQILYFCVGGATSSINGGFCGGGNASGSPAAGGGGMTWVGSLGSFSTSTVYIVAGGGGGAAGTNVSGSDGAIGGGTTGANASRGGNINTSGGSGATQSSGGTGGNSSGGVKCGTDGSVGQGGIGCVTENGGGGGGGYYGGGGGGGNSGGGGGSGFVSNTLTSTSTTQGAGATHNTNGSLKFTYTINSTIVGNNNAGLVFTIATSTTSTITFSSPFANPPSCWVTPNNATNTWKLSPAATSVAITFDISIKPNQSFNYGCLGY